MRCLPLALLLVASSASAESHDGLEAASGAEQAMCALYDEGPWGAALQQWALSYSEQHGRQGRIMALPPTQGYYVTERIDGAMLPPPPPAPVKQASLPRYPPAPAGPRPYDEWQLAPHNSGKIVNRPLNPYKDKFKPSQPAPVQNQPIPVHSAPVQNVDRVDENRQPPQKQVSETDLYLLGAIEKLVYRADIMEKRLRKLEETVHYLVAGGDTKPEPCAANFTRMGSGCYHVSSDAVNWKGANYGCRRLKANMLEINSQQERDTLNSALIADSKFKGGDFWTGGLNPGLLWIWSHSARPVLSNSSAADTAQPGIEGSGRCLAWLQQPAGAYVLRGHDCALRHRYICQQPQEPDKLSNEIERVARKLRSGRKPKIVWTDEP